MKNKSFTIVILDEKTNKGNPVFKFKGNNVARYEAIGLMTLAIAHLTKECIKESKRL